MLNPTNPHRYCRQRYPACQHRLQGRSSATHRSVRHPLLPETYRRLQRPHRTQRIHPAPAQAQFPMMRQCRHLPAWHRRRNQEHRQSRDHRRTLHQRNRPAMANHHRGTRRRHQRPAQSDGSAEHAVPRLVHSLPDRPVPPGQFLSQQRLRRRQVTIELRAISNAGQRVQAQQQWRLSTDQRPDQTCHRRCKCPIQKSHLRSDRRSRTEHRRRRTLQDRHHPDPDHRRHQQVRHHRRDRNHRSDHHPARHPVIH